MAHEIHLHGSRNVVANSKYANLSKQTSTGFNTLGMRHSEEAREKISKAVKGHWTDEECRQKKLEIQRSEEYRQKQSKAHHGKSLSKEHRQKISKAHLGMSYSEETRRKIGEKSKGRKHSDETRRNMSETRKGKKWFYDPNSGDTTFCHPGDCSSNYLPGRKAKTR
jgi:hypothetical protein